MASLKLKHLEQYLHSVEQFENPKIKYEQYATTPHIAGRILHTAQACFGDIDGKMVCDLGSGCGTLCIGASLLGAGYCMGLDIDSDALSISQENINNLDIFNVDFLVCDVTQFLPGKLFKSFDTVVMNPPFGTKQKGVDVEFLKVALQLADTAVYSLHKTSTRNHILTKAKDWGVKAEVLAELRYDIAATYKFHKKKSVDIEVDFIRLSL